MTSNSPADILIVDDEREIVHLLAEVLSDEGYAVRMGYSGKDALQLIAERRPAVVLLDYSMPGMTGAEALSRIRLDYPTLPVVVMSANSQIENLSIPGVTSFLPKPFDLDTVIDCVQRFCLAP